MPSPDAPEPGVAPPAENSPQPLPQPSLAAAGWVVLTMLNIALLVFLVPESMFEMEGTKKVLFLAKVFSALAAGGLLAAGLLWFKSVLIALPERRGFKVGNIVACCLLIPLQVTQQDVVSIYPEIGHGESKFKLVVDNEERVYEPGGKVKLSIGNHTVKITPDSGDNEKEAREKESKDSESKDSEYKERKFPVSYRDVLYAAFNKEYRPQWGLLFRVTIITPDADVEVLIHKKDGEFDPSFQKDPLATELKLPFVVKEGSRNELVYRGANSRFGSIDHLYLPYGSYQFTASEPACSQKKPMLTLNIGTDPRPYTLSFNPLCDPAQ